MKKVFFAGLFHETHTFVDDTTDLRGFEIRRGDQMLRCCGDSSPMGGALDFARLAGWDVLAGADYRAMPSGTVENEVVEAFWEDLEKAWQPGCDGIFLVLHGAMVSDEFRDVEGEILRRIRGLPGAGELPLFGVYDLHANFSQAMAEFADCLVAYRENPHTDAREASVKAAELLERSFRAGEKPRIHLRQTPFIWAPTETGTADEPMRSLEALARKIESRSGEIWVVNVTAGFAFADTPDTGVSFQVVTTGEAGAELEELVKGAGPTSPAGHLSPEEAMRRLKTEPGEGLTVLVEPSDNIGGGAPGDCTGLLRALVGHEITDCAVCINDPDAVKQLDGGRRRIEIGGKGSRFDAGPLALEVELLSRSDGRFELEDKQSHLASVSGDVFDMGPSAVVKHGGVTILLTSRKTPPFDLSQWRSQGIEPANLNAVVVKAAVAHRRAYDPITGRSFTVDTPGPCQSDLSAFPYRYVRWKD